VERFGCLQPREKMLKLIEITASPNIPYFNLVILIKEKNIRI
jgi:hypothetical protein